MKSLVLVVLLAVVAVTVGYEFAEKLDAKQRSISSQAVEAIEDAKLRMPCGFPGLGVPPLAPLRTPYKEITFEGDNLLLAGDIKNFRCDGLNLFEILEFKVVPLRSKLSFSFLWEHVHMSTLYDLLLKTDQGGLHLNMKREGFAKMAIKGLKIWGECKYKLSVSKGSVSLKEFKLYVSLNEVKSEIDGLMDSKLLNHMVNQIIEEFIMLSINDNTENIADIANEIVVPIVNSMLEDTTLGELMGIVGGGGGGEEKKEPCIPPEDSELVMLL